MQNVLVSIIIPAYNVEKYIEKCVMSCLTQTYCNIEVIVVNDGSKDNTEDIIKTLCEKDDRLKVINKDNGGVSSARNVGIENSKGEYLIFVDGDDYLAVDYVEYMLGMAISSSAEFCLSKNCFIQKNEKQEKKETLEILTPLEATELLLSPRVVVGCWNKIFKRSFVKKNNLRFCDDLFYGEGLFFITTAAQLSNKIAVGNRKVYYYRKNNEQSATTVFNINKFYNGEKSINRIDENLTIKDVRVYTMLRLHKSMFCLSAIVRLNSAKKVKEYQADYKRWKNYIKRNIFKLLFKKKISLYRKLLLIGGYISPWFVSKLDNRRRKKISSESVAD